MRMIILHMFDVGRRTCGVVWLMMQKYVGMMSVSCILEGMIGLMDCNNFFVSCERLFRPDLEKKPVAVLSSNDGCIVSRSNEVKDMGIPMGIPHFEIKEQCKKENITLFSSNFALYRDISARVMTTLKSEFSRCEVYSVDEAFFEVADTMTETELYAIRSRIIQKTGIPVSIGVAETKTLAKIGSKIAKKGKGVCIINPHNRAQTIGDMTCGSIWGIGRQTSSALTKMNIRTVSELLRTERSYIRKTFGVMGERCCMELEGIPVYKIGERKTDEQESYMSTRSFAKPVFDKLTLRSALGHHVAHVCEKLRLHGHVASSVSILARGSRFGDFAHRKGSASIALTVPTNDTFVLIEEVSKLFDTIYDPEIPYKKAGVVVSGIAEVEYITASLFTDAKQENKTAVLNDLTDLMNTKYGSGTMRQAITLGSEKWKEKKNLKSPDYTTSWNEIACIKAI